MEHAEMVTLIRGGVRRKARVWADFGAGTGNFTRALRVLLDSESTIYAVDRDAKAMRAQQLHAAAPDSATIIPVQADFTQRLALPPLDGILMANALHFVRDQAATLARLVDNLKPDGRLLLVEYDLTNRVMYVPFPVPPAHFAELAALVGLTTPLVVGTRRSPSSGITMYAAVADKMTT